jgi:hypothetical protein
MSNPKSIATLGIGFGALAVASIGLVSPAKTGTEYLEPLVAYSQSAGPDYAAQTHHDAWLQHAMRQRAEIFTEEQAQPVAAKIPEPTPVPPPVSESREEPTETSANTVEITGSSAKLDLLAAVQEKIDLTPDQLAVIQDDEDAEAILLALLNLDD